MSKRIKNLNPLLEVGWLGKTGNYLAGQVKGTALKGRDLAITAGRLASVGISKNSRDLWKNAARSTGIDTMRILPSMAKGALFNAARKYIFTSKRKLLAELKNAYNQLPDDDPRKQQIAEEIENIRRTPEAKLKWQAATKGLLWGSLVGLAYGAVQGFGRNALSHVSDERYMNSAAYQNAVKNARAAASKAFKGKDTETQDAAANILSRLINNPGEFGNRMDHTSRIFGS